MQPFCIRVLPRSLPRPAPTFSFSRTKTLLSSMPKAAPFTLSTSSTKSSLSAVLTDGPTSPSPGRPWHEVRPTFHARVITPDSAVHPLDSNTVTDAPAKENEDNVFSDRRVMRAPLPAIAPGSLVEEEETSTELLLSSGPLSHVSISAGPFRCSTPAWFWMPRPHFLFATTCNSSPTFNLSASSPTAASASPSTTAL